MPNGRLTQRRVNALTARKKALDVCDSINRGFNVRLQRVPVCASG